MHTLARSVLAGVVSLLALTACAIEPAAEEDVANDSEELVARAARCADKRATTSVTVKAMTINLRHDSDQWERRFPLIADEIVRLDPDVIGLQEVEIADEQASALNDLLVKRGHAKYQIYQKRKSGLRGFFTGEGIGIMSRWPLVDTDHEDTGEMRISLFARAKHPSGGYIDLVNTHLHSAGGPEGDAVRLDQIKQTVRLANRNDECWPQIFTGDMNATVNSPAMKQVVASGFVDSYRMVHGEEGAKLGNTSTVVLKDGAFEQSPKRRIDFILARGAGTRTATPLASIVAFKNHDAKGLYPSDHFGVMTTYTLGL